MQIENDTNTSMSVLKCQLMYRPFENISVHSGVEPMAPLSSWDRWSLKRMNKIHLWFKNHRTGNFLDYTIQPVQI